jgi:lysozyme family protein
MVEFEKAVAVVLAHEGTLSNDKDDNGGTTNYGISLRYLKSTGELKYDLDHDGDIDVGDIVKLSKAQAIDIYREDWWNKYDYERLTSQRVANKVLDMAVNMGQKQAIKLLQRSINRANDNQHLIIDGVFGPLTIQAANLVDENKLVPILKTECAQFYEDLVNHNGQYKKFFAGWLRRAYTG